MRGKVDDYYRLREGYTYTWNDEKANLILRDHHLTFKYNAVKGIDDESAVKSKQYVHGKWRIKRIGKAGKMIIAVVYLERDRNRRLITAWSAGAEDIRKYLKGS